MLFGPYENRNIEQIEEKLKDLSIQYEIVIDEDQLEKGDKDYNENYPYYNPGFKYHVRSAYLDISEEELGKIGDSLERFGIAKPLDQVEETYGIGQKETEIIEESDKTLSFIIKIFAAFIILALAYIVFASIK